MFRLQLGVNRKSTAVRWIGGQTVGVCLSRMKADERAERSKPSRGKGRRGQRGGTSRLGRFLRDTHVDKEVANLLVSAVRSAAPSSTPALVSKPISSRKANHIGRVHIWAVKAGNRLAARRPVQQLIKKVPDDFGYLSRRQAKEMAENLGIGTPSWARFRDWWHCYSYRCRYLGARPEGKDPLSFLAGRRPVVGANDLLDFLSKSDLPGRNFGQVGASYRPPQSFHPCPRCGILISDKYLREGHPRRFCRPKNSMR